MRNQYKKCQILTKRTICNSHHKWIFYLLNIEFSSISKNPYAQLKENKYVQRVVKKKKSKNGS